MNLFAPDYFIHAANVLLLVAYSVRDVLWLRLFAVAASLIAIPFYVLQPTVLWAPLAWSGIFAAINLFQSWLLILERRPVKLTPEEEEIRRLAFQALPPRKVLQVLSIGSWITADNGVHLIEQGKLPDSLPLIVREPSWQRHLAHDLATKIGRLVMDSKRSDNCTKHIVLKART